jgi:hypothetical protein
MDVLQSYRIARTHLRVLHQGVKLELQGESIRKIKKAHTEKVNEA